MPHLAIPIRGLMIWALGCAIAWGAEPGAAKSKSAGCLACGAAERAARAAAHQPEPGQIVAVSEPVSQVVHTASNRRSSEHVSLPVGESCADCCETDVEACPGAACGDCGHCQRRRVIDETGWFNCGCSGSYKFPVPPQYTYHWPGMYSQQLMTEYVSPWRFPPLKPYTDEVSSPATIHDLGSIRPTAARVSLQQPTTGGTTRGPTSTARRPGSTSNKLKQHYGIR